MEMDTDRPVRIAVLDLYDGIANQGMRALRGLIDAADGRYDGRRLRVDTFDVRQRAAVPDLSYDVYISSGGPGSPFDGEGTEWEARYFDWLEALWQHNIRPNAKPKHALFICHSFQMMCRFFEVGAVTKRHRESFGIVPVHRTEAGRRDPLLRALSDPFFAADFRKWQVIQPRPDRLTELGAAIIAREQVPLEPREPAVMGLRLSPEMIGVQFHPEADPDGMLAHFQKPERRDAIIGTFGADRYERLLRRLRDPEYLVPTYDAVVPCFLKRAIRAAQPLTTPEAPLS